MYIYMSVFTNHRPLPPGLLVRLPIATAGNLSAPEVRYNALLAKAKVLGYDVAKMIRDNHPR